MTTNDQLMIYEISLNIRSEWQAHSLSNSGTNGSNRILPRRQLLADGTEVDAITGNIAKRHHAMLLAEYFEETGVAMCPACAARDGRRVAALVDHPDYKNMSLDLILRNCGLCDSHGFLVTAKKATNNENTEARQRLSKHSLIEFSFALALPEHQATTTQLFTRIGGSEGSGQMLMKKPARSGSYGLCIRYKSAGIGIDTDRWTLLVDDEKERAKRHQAILCALRDCILSPAGALTAAMLPHLTGLTGAIVVQNKVGRAPIYSPLEADFVTRLAAMENKARRVHTFESVDQFNRIMDELIETSKPYLPLLQSRKVLLREST